MGNCVYYGQEGPSVVLPFGEQPITIGRSERAQIQIDEECMSRVHCEIQLQGSKVILRDRHSRNGTFVNGEQIAERMLVSGDMIKMGEATVNCAIRKTPIPATSPDGKPVMDVAVTLRLVTRNLEPASLKNTMRIEIPKEIRDRFG